MNRYKRNFVFTFLAIVLIINPFTAFSQTAIEKKQTSQKRYLPAGEVMIADLVISRPAGLVATIGGTAFFIISLPFSALGGNTGDAWESMVVTPATYTFMRPLGEFKD